MNVEFKSSFAKDLKKIDKPLAQRVRKVIEEIEAAKSLSEIPNLKRIRGRGDYYRVSEIIASASSLTVRRLSS